MISSNMLLYTKRILRIVATVCALLMPLFLLGNTYLRLWPASIALLPDDIVTPAQALTAAAWEPLNGYERHFLGARRYNIWIKVTIPKAANPSYDHPVPSVHTDHSGRHDDQDAEFAADLASPFMRRVEFYLLDGEAIIKHETTGMEAGILQPSHPSAMSAFSFARHPQRDLTLMINVRSEEFVAVILSIVSERTFQLLAMCRDAVLGVFIGGLLTLVLFNSLIALRLRDKVLGYYVTYQALSLMVAAIFTGVAMPWLSPFTTDPTVLFKLAVFLGALAFLVQLHFAAEFFALAVNFPLLRVPRKILQLGILCYMAAIPYLSSTFLLAGLGVAMLLGMAFLALIVKHYNANKTIYYFVLSFVGVLVALSVPTMAVLYVIPSTLVTTNYYLAAGLWEAVFFSRAISHRIATLQSERQKIIAALHESSPGSRLNDLLRNRFRSNYKSSEMELTVMAIDIVRFSAVAEGSGATATFAALSRRIAQLSAIVQQHGGIIDRSLGDGLICVFGYNHQQRERHGVQAFHAAVAIQKLTVESYRRNLASNVEEVLLPVRIGINTATILVGKIAATAGLDFTMIGAGIGLVSELEAGCAPFKIMLSAASHQAILESITEPKFISRVLVANKHGDHLLEAYEYNPFADDETDMRRAERHYFDQIGVKPADERLNTAPNANLTLRSRFGTFHVLDFSRSGFGAAGGQLFARKARFAVAISSANPQLIAALQTKKLAEVLVEVRWSRVVSNRAIHGLQIIGLGPRQKSYLVATMQEFCVDSSTAVPRRAGGANDTPLGSEFARRKA